MVAYEITSEAIGSWELGVERLCDFDGVISSRC